MFRKHEKQGSAVTDSMSVLAQFRESRHSSKPRQWEHCGDTAIATESGAGVGNELPAILTCCNKAKQAFWIKDTQDDLGKEPVCLPLCT